MKKAGVYIAIVLWLIIAGGYVLEKLAVPSISIGAVFEEVALEDVQMVVEAYGDFGVCYLSDDEKTQMVKNMAGALGLDSRYEIETLKGSDLTVTKLVKESVNGNVVLKAITQESKQTDGSMVAHQSVYVNITVYNNADCATDYRELVEGMFDAMGIEGNVNVNLSGSIDGNLNYEQRNTLTDNLLEKLDARVVTENRDTDIFTVYAYTQGLKDYVSIGGSKINVNIAIGYDEVKDITQVYLSSPVSSLDY